MRRLSLRSHVLIAALLAGAGCADDFVAPAARPPQIETSAVTPNPHNVVSVIVSAQAPFADSVAVRYGVAGERLDSVTPAVAPADASGLVPVLGLAAGTDYTLQVVAYGGGQQALGELLTFTTGPLPDDLPGYVAGGDDPSPGYVLFAAGMYGIVIDNAGRVVWYRRFPAGPGLNFQAQPTGHYVARPPPADPLQPAAWIEIDPLGDVTRTLGCAGQLVPRFHDLLVRPDGSYWILCDETRTMNLAEQGGRADARVIGTVVQHVSAAGSLLFEWSPFDHFEITDLAAAERGGATVNWTHGNALDLDVDGNLLVSFRSLSEITKIDTRSGDVLWRMGGLRNQFAFQETPMPAFARQHSVRATAQGHLLLLDNLGNPAESRAERYVYDAQARTARLVASYGSSPAIAAQLGGTTQDLPGGRTLVSFGSAERVEEYDASGNVVWRIEAPGYVFRAQRIHSLYRPGIGSPR